MFWAWSSLWKIFFDSHIASYCIYFCVFPNNWAINSCKYVDLPLVLLEVYLKKCTYKPESALLSCYDILAFLWSQQLSWATVFINQQIWHRVAEQREDVYSIICDVFDLTEIKEDIEDTTFKCDNKIWQCAAMAFW